MSEFSLGFFAGVGFCVGISALVTLLLFYAADSDWQEQGRVIPGWKDRR